MLGALDEPIPIPWTHFHDLTAPRQEHEKCMQHASAVAKAAAAAATAAAAAATAVAEEAKAAEAAEGQPPSVQRLSTSELENELLRRKQAKEAAASEDVRRRSAVCLMQSTTPLSLWLMQRARAQVGARSAQRRRLVPCRLHCRTRIRGPLPIVHASRHLTWIRLSLVWE